MKDRMVNQGVKLSAKLKTMLEDKAVQMGMKSSALARVILESYLNDDANKSEEQKLREIIAEALTIILATRGRGPMTSEMAESLVNTLFLSQES